MEEEEVEYEECEGETEEENKGRMSFRSETR